MQIHEKLRVLRQCRNWTQEDMAERLGWAVNTYAKIERGESDLKMEKLKQAAEALGVELNDLLTPSDSTIFNFAENYGQNNLAHTILLSESQCAHELEKARILLAQKDQEIAWLREKTAHLEEIVALLKQGGTRGANENAGTSP